MFTPLPQVPFVMPQLGESIAEAVVVRFLAKPGDNVAAGQDVLEVETSKATMNVAAPASGKVVEWFAREQESYAVGAKLGVLEVSAAEAARLGIGDSFEPAEHESMRGSVGSMKGDDTNKAVSPTVRGLPVPANATGASYMSPRLKARMAELGIHAADLAGVAGSGAGGRVTIQDFEQFLANLEQHRLTGASSMRVAVALVSRSA